MARTSFRLHVHWCDTMIGIITKAI
jgi:hypothetical protein